VIGYRVFDWRYFKMRWTVSRRFFRDVRLKTWTWNRRRNTFLEECRLGPGVDVMITNFCDFCLFSAKKLAFFSKTNVIIEILHNLALFCVKTPIFAIFSAKIFLKITTSVPEIWEKIFFFRGMSTWTENLTEYIFRWRRTSPKKTNRFEKPTILISYLNSQGWTI
jgi:hypothetical protein